MSQIKKKIWKLRFNTTPKFTKKKKKNCKEAIAEKRKQCEMHENRETRIFSHFFFMKFDEGR